MRRLVPAAVAALVVAAGCGTEHPAQVRGAATYLGPAATASPKPSRTPSQRPSPTSDVPGALAGFPLSLGYAAENGDDHSPVVVTSTPASTSFSFCGRTVWDPLTGTTDVSGVEFRGEAEYYLGRTLVLYPSADAAADAVDVAGDSVAACPDEPSGEDTGTTHTVLDQPLGDESVVWADTYYVLDDGERLHDTGLTVYHLVRVGRAVLLAYDYGEGNGSPESRHRSIAQATGSARAVTGRMAECRWSFVDCAS